VTRRRNIRDGERLSTITVTVREADPRFGSALAWRLRVADADGEEFTLKVWHTHGIETWWREGWRYVLTDGRGSRRRRDEVVLHSTSDFAVHRPPDTVDILALGDTHIGREHRPRDDNPPQHTARQFLAAMGYAMRYDVDAVVHAGDLFDEAPRESDMAIADAGFGMLHRHGVPFYHVFGNHGVETAETYYDERANGPVSHLDTAGTRIADTVALYGVDHAQPTELQAMEPGFEPISDVSHRLLVVHTELDPPRPNSNVAVEDLCRGLESLDFIVAGHLHDPESGVYEGIPIQFLGSTADISANQSAQGPSAWLLRFAPEGIACERIDVR